MESNEDKERNISELVERYRVCWEVWPDYTFVRGEKRLTGFSLELSGTHEPGVEHYEPGCEHCVPVYKALQAIASHIIPQESRPSRYEVSIFDSAIHYTRKRRNRPEISLTIKIVHRNGFEQPVDECQSKCLTEMEKNLKALGAFEGEWHP